MSAGGAIDEKKLTYQSTVFNGNDPQNQNNRSFDVRSDRESIDLVVTMMNEEDLANLKEHSKKGNTSGIKKWAMQRSYANLRATLEDLQHNILRAKHASNCW
jgi:hypothetical protein